MRRFWLSGALIAAVAALTGSVGIPVASASPSAGYINVEQNSAGSPVSNPGLLSVTLGSDMPITTMTVDIVPVGGGTSLLSLPMSDFTVPANNGTGYYGTWTVTIPNTITTSQLAIGSYWVEVTAASNDASISDVLAGTLNFLNEVTFPTFTSNGTTFNYDNQDVTFTGSADVQSPGGTPSPFAGSLVLTDSNSDTYPVTTAADGSFSIKVPAKSDEYWVEYQGDPTTAKTSSPPIAITVSQFPVTMTARLAVRHAKYGQPDKVTGTLAYSDNNVSKPLAGTTVSLYAYPGAPATATTVTGSSGTFSMSVPTTGGSSTWTVQSTGSEYFTSATANLPMTIAQRNYIQRFHASLNAFAVVHVRACIGASTGVVRVEYAARATGPWRALGRLPETGLSCPHGTGYGYGYAGNFYARLASAYYRVVYVGNYQVQGAVTKSVHLSRLFTKITAFRVSPRHFSGGGHFHASGRLWARSKNGKWKPYGNRKVIVVFKYQGTYYRERLEPKTNSAGRFSGRFPVYSSTPVFAQYNGDATHFASASKRVRITDSAAAAGARPAAAQRLAVAMRFMAAQPALLWAPG